MVEAEEEEGEEEEEVKSRDTIMPDFHLHSFKQVAALLADAARAEWAEERK